ncbi:MAG: DUF1269 domain-containing protein [Actinomycetia bacterium]|nr:DUF1269 domain-containing protein [Actinomycetes bacterium]
MQQHQAVTNPVKMKGNPRMAPQNLVLYAASYDDVNTAKEDFETLKAAEGPDLAVVAAVVMSRDADGNVDVLSKGGAITGASAVLGGGAGLVVGLFAPPLLAATAVGAGIGAVLGHLTKKHKEKELGVELEEYFPENSSAVVVVLDSLYLDRVEKALSKADKKISKAIVEGDYEKLQKALDESSDDVTDAVNS